MHDRTWELMQKHLDTKSFYMVSAHDSAPSEDALQLAAAEFGCVFPAEFVAHSTNQYGGLYVEVKEEFWPRPKEFDVGPFWSFLYGLFTFNLSEDIPEFMDLAANAREFQSRTGIQAVPCLKIIGDADLYCFDEDGNIAQYNHELNQLESEDRSFFELLDDELGELVQRKDKKLAQRNR